MRAIGLAIAATSNLAVRLMLPVRFSSTVASGTCSAKRWLEQLCWRNIPNTIYKTQYDRSSGPGGQNVNKVNSKCTLTINDFSKCSWFPIEIRQQVIEKNLRYYAKKQDKLVVQSDSCRSRERNKEECLKRLAEEVRNIVFFAEPVSEATTKKWEKIRSQADKERMLQKKRRSDKKSSRSRDWNSWE
ncbi:HDL424Cp [Eremothecium sinecaudum]|uniref:HDL424Cp n=1 Tax=Eremothecium sinecaudum TaxID=45286 RepID=A0A0X8HRV4_9SACH|nr:HDL424Cp [Eremothecium sinecaudum]AMD20320.1 HDL424Cp [Eremothecium sinecaudum]